MLQKVDQDRLDKVWEIINSYDWRFPGTQIAKDLEWDRGVVSSYLNGKKAISDNFYSKFISQYAPNVVREETSNYLTKRRDLKNTESKEVPVRAITTNLSNITVYHDDNSHEEIVATLPKAMFPGADHGEKAKGDSMYPIIMNQAWLVGKICGVKGITFGEKYIIRTKDGLDTTKYVHPVMDEKKRVDGKLLLVAHNKSIPAQEINIDDIIFACRILWIINPT